MIRLQTFGGAVLFGDDGDRLLGAASQRRILALVSVLAASEAGLTRDKLVGLIWPEAAPRRARHSLTQTMYAARRALECDDLFQATEDIRLNPERIGSDVGDFEAALARGDDEGAVALYRGPFLDGFYLPTSEFDWWLHHRRTDLEQQAADALNRLATAGEEAGEWESAVSWLRRLSVLRPSDSAIAVRLMRGLSARGDRAGALQHASVHSRLLREQYELEPESEVLALAAELRDTARVAEVPEAPGATEASGVAEAPGDAVPAAAHAAPPARSNGAVPAAMPAEADAGRRPVEGPRFKRWWFVAAAVAVTAVVVVAILVIRRKPPALVYKSLDQRVVVTPFRVGGADRSLEYLRDGIVEMLSTRLADDTAARAVDAGAVLAAWRAAGITRSADVPRDSIVRLARRFGAERVVIGSVVGTAARVIISAAVLEVPSGQVGGEATVEGPATSLTQLVDQLAAKLLLVEAGETDRVAEHMTASLPALRAYLDGLDADAHGDYGRSVKQFSRAVQLDSGFALSALHLALAAGRLNDYDLERQALHRAWRFHQALSDRDEAQLTAVTGPDYPAPSTAGASISAWEQAARLAPNRAEVWYGLAKRILTDGGAAGLGDVRDRTLAALQQAEALDPNDAAVRLLRMRVTGQPPPASAPGQGRRPSPLDFFFRWREAAQKSDSAGLARVAALLPATGPVNLREIAASAAFEGFRPEDGARALAILSGRAPDGEQAQGLLLAQHALAIERGRPAEALELTRQIQRLGPASRAHLRLRVLDALFGGGDSASAQAAADELRRTAANPDLPNAASDACALAQWQLARGDVTGASASLDRMRSSRLDQGPAPVAAPPPVCAALVEAEFAAVTRARDAKAHLARADSLVLTSVSVGDVAAYAPIVLSRLYRRAGDPAAALAAIRRRPFFSGVWPRYLATDLKLEGDLAQEVGDRAGAIAAYRQYLSLRANPDASLAAEVATVRAALADLVGVRKN